jgi:hypothetical protein
MRKPSKSDVSSFTTECCKVLPIKDSIVFVRTVENYARYMRCSKCKQLDIKITICTERLLYKLPKAKQLKEVI